MDEQLVNQRSVLLARMASDKKRSLTGAALKKLPQAVQKELGLDAATAAEVLAGLAREEYVGEKRRGKSITYQLTEAGAEYAKTLPPYPPPHKVEPAHDDVQLLGQQKAFALFQLLVAKENKLSQAQLKTKLTNAKAKPVAFNPPTVEWVTWLLAGEGSTREHKRGKAVSYELTPEGTVRLAASEQHPDVELTLSGAALTRLTAAARGAGGAHPPQTVRSEPTEAGAESILEQSRQPAPPPAPDAGLKPVPPTADSAAIILGAFRELLREKHAHTGLVPIHEVRQMIAARHGEPTARHDALDPQIRQLRRDGRLRLVSIADQSRASSEQLGQSIPGENEIFFYLGEPL